MKIAEPIVITSPSFSRSKELLDELRGLGFEPLANEVGHKLAGKELIDFLCQKRARIAIVGTEKVDKEIIDALSDLRFLSKYGVGTDNIDLDALKLKGIGFGWTAGVNKRSVAELVLAVGIGHFRNVIPNVRKMSAGVWNKDGGRQLSGTTLGIIGLGNTGGELARIARPLVSKIRYFDIARNHELEASLDLEFARFEEVISSCNWLSFHVPLTRLTRNMLTPERLALLDPDCLVINSSRGDVLNFELMISALREGRLGGFACDVFADEPFNAAPYGDLLNFYPTPHIGGNASEAVAAMGKAAIEHVKHYVLHDCRQESSISL